MSGGIDVDVGLEGYSRIDFDKKKVRKALRREGGEIRKIARKKIARKALSSPGEYPGRATGATQRSIKVKVGSGGYWVKVMPYRTSEMGQWFYPAYLYYGTPTVGKRDNYMADSLEERETPARAAITEALKDSLVPRKF